MDAKVWIYPRELPKKERLNYNVKKDTKLNISRNDIIKNVRESIMSDVVLNIYLTQKNEFKFKLNNDMDSIFDLEDFKEDWLQFRINPNEYKWIMSKTKFIESEECCSLIKRIESNFINAGVTIT